MKEINSKDIAIEGLDIILKGNSLEYGIDPNEGYNILIKGLPGTGKTTLGLALLDAFSKKTNSKVKVISMLEEGHQIFKICENFGFFEIHKKLKDRETKDRFVVIEGDVIIGEDSNILEPEEENIRYLMIDGISAIKYIYIDEERKKVHKKMKTILDELKKRGLFTIIVSEEPGNTEDRFFEYIVDGIIHLSVEGARRNRYIEILKLRWKDYYPGKHSFMLQSVKEGSNNYGVSIFPSVRCYFSESKQIYKEVFKVSSGVCGFDRLVGGGFLPGEIILLIGEPGSGKTIFGMQFLKEIQRDKNDGNVLCISFEYNFEEIKEMYKDFGSLKGFIQDDEKSLFVYFNPYEITSAEFSSKIVHLIKTENVTRLLIDSISSLKNRFESIVVYANYILSLIRVLKNFNVTSILTWEIPSFFQSPTHFEIYNSEDVDTIIALRQYDFNNSIFRGLAVLKSLGREQNTTIQNMCIATDKGLYLEEKGWAKVGLLGGEPENISETKLFFKFFYQSKPHHEVEEDVFMEFSGRYPKEIFTKVLKNDPSPTHWSFKGYYGVGHSNTKVISVRKHVMDILRENGNLTALPDDIYNKHKERFENLIWNDTKEGSKFYYMVPYYVDVGVLVYQKVFLLALTEGISIENAKKKIDEEKMIFHLKNWNELKALKEKFVERKDEFGAKGIFYLFVMPNTVADTRQFMAFFLELLLAHGGKLWSSENGYSIDLDECRKIFIENVKTPEFAKTLNFLKDLVGDGIAIPNPNIGGHYHSSIFSRRWYGKIEVFKEDLKTIGEKPDFSITLLPEIDDKIGSFSALDLYSLGMIKGALAQETGWMFINELLEFYVDLKKQCKQRRGLPIVKKEIYESELLKNALALDYSVIKSIFFSDDEQRTIKTFRTSDIPYYYYIERLLPSIIKNIFIESNTAKTIQYNIVDDLEEKLVESNLSLI